MSKFLVSLVLGASAVLGHNHSSNGSASTGMASGSNDPTSAPTNANDTTAAFTPALGTSGFTAEFGIGLDLTAAANVTVASLAACPALPASVPVKPAKCPTTGCAAVACHLAWGIETFLVASAPSAKVSLTKIAAAATRRSLSEDMDSAAARKLASSALTASTEITFSGTAGDADMEAAFASLTADNVSTKLAGSLNYVMTAAGIDYGTMTATATVTSDLVYADGTTKTAAEVEAAQDAAASSSSSAVSTLVGFSSLLVAALAAF